ncbi:MAG: tssE [Massilia sp.]|nr:tssE [Massilia sp.]MDB5950479.1 tssE [Massilia sp.]
MTAVVASGLIEENAMQGFTTGLFDRLDDDSEHVPVNKREARARALKDAMRSVTRDLQALLNTRSALSPESLDPYPAVSGSIVNYGLIDFAGMCMNSDTDQKEICNAVRLAIERHEPRLHKVAVSLRATQDVINRVDFVITAQLKSEPHTEPLSFNAVFRPSIQQYSIESKN